MRCSSRPGKLLACLFTVFLFVGSVDTARADRLAEFLFWDSLGNAVAKGAKAHADYRAERKHWKDNIAAAKAELKRCGGCASARAKLKKWQGIENKFQEVAGGLAHAVRMPPNVAKWLDIDMPLAAGTPPNHFRNQLKKEIPIPKWASERPPFCQEAVNEHISCLNRFRKTKRLLVATSLGNAVLPGAMCFDSSKLYDRCFSKDYASFKREKEIQTLRAAGKIIPEYIPGPYTQVYFGQVPENFVPRLPPQDVVRAKLYEGDIRHVQFSMKKKKEGQLGFVRCTSSEIFGQLGFLNRRVSGSLV